mgnify:CR=1 FL=1|tara:strand:+ start:492 stop:1112 length:621 start_codon:yes stop_codon:yes gene_type:complete
MNSIIAVEDHMVAETEALFGNVLKQIDCLPGALNLGLLKQLLITAPSVHFAFMGGKEGVDDDGSHIDGRFSAYVITRHVGNDSARRRGDSTTIGSYQIINSLIPKLHGSVVDDVGRMACKSIQNMFTIQLEETFKASLYAITFEVKNMPFVFEADLSSLDDFITFDAQYDIPEHEATAEHDKWLEEPANHTTSEPDLTDTLTDLNT